MNPYTNSDLRSFLDNSTLEDIDRMNKEMIAEDDRQHKAFMDALKVGKCYLCGNDLNSFDPGCFCLHWFTYPIGIKKRYFEQYLNNRDFSFTRIESYFRWMAETENPIANISDLREEMSNSAFHESTMKYKNIEWSISIGHTDIEGHVGAKVGDKPHYHIQMIVDGNIFIKFNDLHIYFTDENLFNIELLNQNKDRMKFVRTHGEGISILEEPETLELIDKYMKVTDDEDKATFSTSTMIHMPDGNPIPMEKIIEAINRSKESGKPISHFLPALIPEANVAKIFTAGDGVPEIAKRSGKK